MKKSIEISNGIQKIEYEVFNFPCGEKHVKLCAFSEPRNIVVKFEFTKNDDIIELLLVCDALKNLGCELNDLLIPYVPFSRQDRVNVNGECFSLRVFCDLINSLGFKKVTIFDPHSDVTPALLRNCEVVYQHQIFQCILEAKGIFFLVSPDGGALKKIYKLAEKVYPIGVLECSKQRNVLNGEITGIQIHCGPDLKKVDCYIVDDICDGGKTFVEIAKELKKRNAGKIVLMVSHGFFTKGLQVFDGLIDEIYTSSGRVK